MRCEHSGAVNIEASGDCNIQMKTFFAILNCIVSFCSYNFSNWSSMEGDRWKFVYPSCTRLQAGATYSKLLFSSVLNLLGSRDGAVVEHLPPTQASHQCGPGSIPGLGVKCGLSLLLVLVLAPRGFSPGSPVFPSPQKPTFPNSNSIWNPRATGLSVISLLSVTLVK